MVDFGPLMLGCGLFLSGVAYAGSERPADNQNLLDADRMIGEAQTEFRAALADHDQAATRAAGNRLRALKLRRETIARDLAAAQDHQRRQEAEFIVRQRSEIAREIEQTGPRVDQAATAFDDQPTPRRGAKLRDLTLQEIQLRDTLRRANALETGRTDQGPPLDQGKPAPGAAAGQVVSPARRPLP
jgi:hypothetical protein